MDCRKEVPFFVQKLVHCIVVDVICKATRLNSNISKNPLNTYLQIMVLLEYNFLSTLILVLNILVAQVHTRERTWSLIFVYTVSVAGLLQRKVGNLCRINFVT